MMVRRLWVVFLDDIREKMKDTLCVRWRDKQPLNDVLLSEHDQRGAKG